MADDSRVVRVFSSVGAIATTAAAATKLATTDNAAVKNFYPTEAFIEVVSVGGTIVTVASVSIGTNATNYDNIIPATGLIGLLTTGIQLPLRPTGTMLVVPPGSDIYFRIQAAPVGTSVVQTVNVYLLGFYK
jgi:hypothetical protein